jgi:large subunit ribosomal protein L29
MKTKELLELSVSELTARKRELKDELFHLRIQKASGQLEKPSQLRALRKEIARVETILTQRRHAAGQDQKVKKAAVATK